MPFTIAIYTASVRRPEPSEDRLAVHHVPGASSLLSLADRGGGPAADLVLGSSRKPSAVAGETTCAVVAVRDDGRIGASVGELSVAGKTDV